MACIQVKKKCALWIDIQTLIKLIGLFADALFSWGFWVLCVLSRSHWYLSFPNGFSNDLSLFLLSFQSIREIPPGFVKPTCLWNDCISCLPSRGVSSCPWQWIRDKESHSPPMDYRHICLNTLTWVSHLSQTSPSAIKLLRHSVKCWSWNFWSGQFNVRYECPYL